MHLPVSYKLKSIDRFMYMLACLVSSIIICMHALHVITLKHCHIVAMGMTLLQLPNSVINIADIRSAFNKTLASERFRRNAVDGATLQRSPPLAGFYASITIKLRKKVQ